MAGLRLMSALLVEAHAHTLTPQSSAMPRRLLQFRQRARELSACSKGNSLVQHIYQLASAGEVDLVAEAMEQLTPSMLALDAPLHLPPGKIGYQHVYSDARFSMGIFVLPAGSSIPLHDHPHMTVLSKLIFGALHVTSYDLPEAASEPRPALFGGLRPRQRQRRLRCAPAQRTVVAAPAATLKLDPVHGNLHAFRALNDTAVFDVLLPPYNDAAGRSCHYYAEVDEQRRADGHRVTLEEVSWPPTLKIASMQYEGPRCGPECE
uniref:Cysteine dioxygenase n=1 Tax=Coccolithus braarudii TaxID=221442 RepID=A0A7S0LJF8_9EUKA|mmetsp:Transcript_39491/g.84172  ORF Transcript_39491/g.84172 Transcript_39491/m.84172 type:complete len:263 (+) Transcript_39491:18-806(+)